MNRLNRFLRFTGLALVLQISTFAGDTSVNHLKFHQPWARATVTAAQAGAVYLEIRNSGATADSLIGAAAPNIAERVELHSHSHDNGIMRMRQVDKVVIPAKGSAEFEPGGYHIMLMNLKRPLQEGQAIPLKLRFQRAGEVKLDVRVLGLTAGGDDAGHKH